MIDLKRNFDIYKHYRILWPTYQKRVITRKCSLNIFHTYPLGLLSSCEFSLVEPMYTYDRVAFRTVWVSIDMVTINLTTFFHEILLTQMTTSSLYKTNGQIIPHLRNNLPFNADLKLQSDIIRSGRLSSCRIATSFPGARTLFGGRPGLGTRLLKSRNI